MEEATFEKQVIDSLSSLQRGINTMQEEIDMIKERIVDDSLLSEDDKAALDEALEEEKEGKLLSKEQAFA